MLTDKDFRCFDNGGRSADRYTILPGRQHWRTLRDERSKKWFAFGCDDRPYHPQGIGMSCEIDGWQDYRYLGKKVPLSTLPPDVILLARQLFDGQPFQAPLV